MARPLNFFALIDTKDMDFLAMKLKESIQLKKNHTFGFSHYPTATSFFGETSDKIGFWEMTRHISVW